MSEETKEIAVVKHGGDLLDFTRGFSEEQKQLLKDTICKEATDNELQMFMYQCVKRRLDPFIKQIYAIKRWDKVANRYVMGAQTGIDGSRLIAERTGKYRGQLGPQWCGPDGIWKDVWLEQKYPAAARVGIIHKDFTTPIWGVALWREYVQTTQDGKVTHMWDTMAANQIAKCAESLGLRKAFPEDLGGIYTKEEMEQADQDVRGADKAKEMQAQIQGADGPKITPRAPLAVNQPPGADIAGPPTGDELMDWIVPALVKPIAGRRIGKVKREDLKAAVQWAQGYFEKEKKTPTGRWAEFFDKAVAVLELTRPEPKPKDDIIDAEFKEMPEPGASG